MATSIIQKDFIWHLQANIVTASNGLFNFTIIPGYVPIFCYVTYPDTIQVQRHVDINYNPANETFYGQTDPNTGIEVKALYARRY